MLNRIRSVYFVKIIANHLEQKRKLKIFSYNKVLMNKVDITIADYIKIYIDKIFKPQKYSEDIETQNKSIRDCGLKYINSTDFYIKHHSTDYIINKAKNNTNIEKFTDIILLNLSGNKIENIEPLFENRFNSLEYLFLNNNNNISNIKAFDGISARKFKNLKRLNLSMNKISDITVLKYAKLKNLESIDLSLNDISDIRVFRYAYFKKIKEIYLFKNKISDISVFQKTNFKFLEILDLSSNKITNIEILSKVKFNQLENLNLGNNEISDIKVFQKTKFENLVALNLKNNKINEINSAFFENLEKLKLLNISGNEQITKENIFDKKENEKFKFKDYNNDLEIILNDEYDI